MWILLVSGITVINIQLAVINNASPVFNIVSTANQGALYTMAIAIKSAADIARKFISVTPGRASDYAEGVANPTKSWAKETADAAARYDAAVTAAIGRKAFQKGVAKSGDAKWQENSIQKGVPRWPVGVAGAEKAYAEGFAPFQSVIAGLTLPPRGPAGDPSNINRVAVIAAALHKKKVGG